MDEVRVLEIKKSIFSCNDKDAESLRNELTKNNCYFVNVMSSPGSGKTTTLIALINQLKDFKIKVLEADLDGDCDAHQIAENTNAEALQLHTGGMCHLDAKMAEFGLNEIGYKDADLIFLENVGNLVCPAEFDTGSHLNINILSVPEGWDKPLKYPLMFEVSDVVIINKIDVLPYFNFDVEKCKEWIHKRNASAEIFMVSALTGEGIKEVAEFLRKKVKGE